MAGDISAYNVQSFIYKIENLKKWEYPFERLKHIKKQYDEMGSDPNEEEKKQDTEQKLEAIKEENEDENEETKENTQEHSQ